MNIFHKTLKNKKVTKSNQFINGKTIRKIGTHIFPDSDIYEQIKIKFYR